MDYMECTGKIKTLFCSFNDQWHRHRTKQNTKQLDKSHGFLYLKYKLILLYINILEKQKNTLKIKLRKFYHVKKGIKIKSYSLYIFITQIT